MELSLKCLSLGHTELKAFWEDCVVRSQCHCRQPFPAGLLSSPAENSRAFGLLIYVSVH